MAFTFTQARELKPEQTNPFANLISKSLQNYGQGVQAAYMPRQLEADIFHKTISPLAMLASSPFFTALNPGQQQQIASYISQMLSNTPAVGGSGSGGGGGGFGGTSIPQSGSPQQSGGSQDYGDASQDEPAGEQTGGSGGLVPNTAAEHYTQGFGETAFTPGTVHRDKEGHIISTPTGTQVERQQGILSGATKIGKLYNQYTELAKELADSGEIKSDISRLAGGIGKLNIPGAKKVEEFLGGTKLAQKAAKFDDLKAKMRPGLREIGLSDSEIDDILSFRGGESGKSIGNRLQETKDYINSLTKTGQNILGGGFNVSSKRPAISKLPAPKTPVAKSISEKIRRDEEARADAEYTAAQFGTTPEKILEAQSLGIKDAAKLRDWLRGQNG